MARLFSGAPGYICSVSRNALFPGAFGCPYSVSCKALFSGAFGYPYSVSWKTLFQVFSVLRFLCRAEPFSGAPVPSYPVTWKALFQLLSVILSQYHGKPFSICFWLSLPSVMESLFSESLAPLCAVSWKALFYGNITSIFAPVRMYYAMCPSKYFWWDIEFTKASWRKTARSIFITTCIFVSLRMCFALRRCEFFYGILNTHTLFGGVICILSLSLPVSLYHYACVSLCAPANIFDGVFNPRKKFREIIYILRSSLSVSLCHYACVTLCTRATMPYGILIPHAQKEYSHVQRMLKIDFFGVSINLLFSARQQKRTNKNSSL